MRNFVGLGAFLLIVGACSVFESTEPTRLTYEGRSVILSETPVSVDAVVTVRNAGSKTRHVSGNGCPLYIAAYTTPDREGSPVWESDGTMSDCPATLVLRLITLAPGDSHDYRVRATLPSSLPKATYYLAMLGANGPIPVAVGQVNIP